MGLLIAAFLLASATPQKDKGPGQDPAWLARRSAANTKFRKMIDAANTLSVDMDIKQIGNPVDGHAVLVLKRPNKLYYHMQWGNAAYTYTILNGQATEVDLGTKTYDEYAVPGWTAPEANGSDWVGSFFPTVFVTSELLLPPDCFDEQGHVTHYAIGSGDEVTEKNSITFSNYRMNEPVSDSKFKQTVPVGLSVYGTPRPAPPIQINGKLPDVKLNKGTLVEAIGGSHALIALLDPSSAPCVASLKVLKNVKGTKVIVLNANSKGSGLLAGSLRTYYDPSGNLEDALRAPMTPLYYFVDGKGKVLNVWYGFDRDNPKKFADQITAAIGGSA